MALRTRRAIVDLGIGLSIGLGDGLQGGESSYSNGGLVAAIGVRMFATLCTMGLLRF